ncbi:hypothetical protein DMC30DRAFT_419455 [Rhodotorula diobovata]|uniref:Uncharacterized protein n=1 Tax=Rhodotorula diobovata TaxID=5288 RepID=A0A5C5FPA5_9BASI|nr:hypothetical protein DMC30DRAFT_419455 [Rhodotorula diobovata]
MTTIPAQEVTALDTLGCAIRATFNARMAEQNKGITPRAVVIDGLPAVTAAYAAFCSHDPPGLPSGYLLTDRLLPIGLAPVELRLDDRRNEAQLIKDLRTPMNETFRRRLLEGKEGQHAKFRLEFYQTEQHSNGARHYELVNVDLKAGNHPSSRSRRCSLKLEAFSPANFHHFFLLRAIARLEVESKDLQRRYWLVPGAWYACLVAMPSDELDMFESNAARLRHSGIGKRLAAWEVQDPRKEMELLAVAAEHQDALSLYADIVKNTVEHVKAAGARGVDLQSPHELPFLSRSLSHTGGPFTPQRREGPATVLNSAAVHAQPSVRPLYA